MQLKAALAAGVAGSIVMFTAVQLFPRFSRLEHELDRFLAAQLTGRDAGRAPEQRLAETTSLALGVLFALPYAALWDAGVGQPGIRGGLVFGALHGSAIVLSEPLLKRLNPDAFRLPRRAVWVSGEILDHALYGLVVGVTYQALGRTVPSTN